MTAQEIINDNYAMLDSQVLASWQRAQLYYTIVDIKYNENIQDIYLDVKNFIKNYIISLDEQRYNYDKIDQQKILKLVGYLVLEQKIAILEFLKKMCVRHQYEDDWPPFESFYYQAKIDSLKRTWYYPLSILKYIYFKFGYSNKALFLTLSLFVACNITLLLPNPWNYWPSLFKVEYHEINDSFLINHIMNVLMGLFEFNINFNVLPENIFALVILLLSKALKILVVVGYIIEKIVKKINFND